MHYHERNLENCGKRTKNKPCSNDFLAKNHLIKIFSKTCTDHEFHVSTIKDRNMKGCSVKDTKHFYTKTCNRFPIVNVLRAMKMFNKQMPVNQSTIYLNFPFVNQ